LPTAPGRHDAVPDNDEPHDGDADLAREHEERHPPRHQPDEREPDERHPQQRLVGDRVEDLADIGHQAARPGDVAVDPVGDHGDDEDCEGREALSGIGPVLREQHRPEDGDEQDAQHGEGVGQVPGAGASCDG
jgi:hypothetical protein